MPILVLEDGTVMCQSVPCMEFLSRKYDMMPTDLMARYRGEKAAEFAYGDHFQKHIGPMPSGDEREAKMKEYLEVHFPAFMNDFATKCLGDSKYLCGETLTMFDFRAAGMFLNFILNTKSSFGEGPTTVFNEKAPERLKKYIGDFKEEMKDYLDARPQHPF